MLLDHYSTVIFDLFHTLTSLEAVKAPGPRTADILGVPRERWNDNLFQHSCDRLTGRIKDPYLIIEQLARMIDPDIRPGIIARAVEIRTARFMYALMHPDRDTLDTLQNLRYQKKRIGLISNADVMERSGWSESPLSEFFDCVVFSCDVGAMKPDHAIYRICLDKLKVTPVECVYAGDGSHDELKGAQELGMTTVLVTHVIRKLWPERIPIARPYADYEIEQLSAIAVLTGDHDLSG